MLDAELYGLHPGGHHLTSVLLHAASTVLLFLSLRRMTGSLWRSAFVAALFAVHPLRVESVAWISERKDVLAGFFFMLVLWTYAGYVRKPSRGRYALVTLFLFLGLLSKNMLVTAPCVLLLLDVWPLGRISFPLRWQGVRPLVLEKLPLFALSLGSCVATVLAPETINPANKWTLLEQVENALTACLVYLWQMVWPAGLMIPYLEPFLPWGQLALAALVVGGVSAGVYVLRRQKPYLWVGWLWYLGVLFPASGIIQISYYVHADRYTYIPQIGIGLMIAWGAADLAASWRHCRLALGCAAGIVLALLAACAWIQAGYWWNGTTLWTRALACEARNPIVCYGMGEMLALEGRTDEAIAFYEKALDITPDYGMAHCNLGDLLQKQAKLDEAEWHYRETIRIEPKFAGGYAKLAELLLKEGRYQEAEGHARRALELYPGYGKARSTYGRILSRLGRKDEAIGQFQEILQFDPENAIVHADLGNELLAQGRNEEAQLHARRAAGLRPRDPVALYNLGNVLAATGDGEGAVGCYQQAILLEPRLAEAYGNLGILLGRSGRIEDAVAYYRKALELQPENASFHNNLGVALAIQSKSDEAATHYREAMRLDPNYLQPCLNLGDLLAGQKKTGEARKGYEAALRIDPDNAEAKAKLARLASGGKSAR
jgi:tetratricopeptide (TPR) repeat protein